VCTNVFDIHIGPLWGTNIDAQYFWDPCATSLYCIANLFI
jgi:hypothetical protein